MTTNPPPFRSWGAYAVLLSLREAEKNMTRVDDWQKAQEKCFQSLKEGKCGCHRCINERDEIACHMVVCPGCGNKRCPHATNHNLACTNSNEPGQPGSIYA